MCFRVQYEVRKEFAAVDIYRIDARCGRFVIRVYLEYSFLSC